MDFIRESVAFDQWLRTNFLPPASQLLWYKLFMLSNGAGWPEWFVVQNLDLMALVQLKNEKIFVECRKKLLEAGLITYEKGKKGSPNRYKLNSLLRYTGKTTVQTTVQTPVKTTAQTTDYYKRKENEKENINPLNPPSGESACVIREIIEYFNKRCKTEYKPYGKSSTRHINARLNEGYKLADFIAVVDKKALEWETRPDMVKFLRPETLFGAKFEGYLNQPDAKPPTPQKSKFADYKGRDWDFAELERMAEEYAERQAIGNS